MSGVPDLESVLAARAATAREPVPRRGQNKDFDRYFDDWLGDEVPEGEFDELRRAAWVTWRTDAPTAIGRPGRNGLEEDGDDDDEDLARAIALSREDHSLPGSVPPGEDDEDEQLRRAIAMSEEEARAPKRMRRESTPEEERKLIAEALKASMATSQPSSLDRSESDEAISVANQRFQAEREADREAQRQERLKKLGQINGTTKSQQEPTSSAGSSSTLPAASNSRTQSAAAQDSSRLNNLAFDRKKLEQERLARQAARESASGSVTPTLVPSKPAVANIGRSANIAGPSTPTIGPSTSAISHPLQSSSVPSDAAGEYYPNGELRHCDLTVVEPGPEPTFSVGDILGKPSQISLIIMCSFCIDDEWLGRILPDPHIVPQILIRPNPRDQPTWEGKVQAQPSGEVFCYPKMAGEYGSAHMKFFWIFYKTGRLRVAISTGNMVDYDWDTIENSTFIQDFLPAPRPVPLDETRRSHGMPLQFRYLFIHLKVHKALKYLIEAHSAGSAIPFSPNDGFSCMDKYDWSRAAVQLVMSIPGSYEGWDEMDKWGICRLGKVLKDEGWRPKKGEKVVAEYQGSSLGQYGMDWFDQFYLFCRGKTARDMANKPKALQWAPVKILYPSLKTVDSSVVGRTGGGTMFVGKAWNSVMKGHFHDANSKRGGALMHAKYLVATFEPQERALGFEPSPFKEGSKRKAGEVEDENEGVGGWVYVGSHNFSSAAWGTLNVKKSPPVLSIRNYELGIAFPLPRKDARLVAERIVPYKRPARPYGPSDVPWDQKLHMPSKT